MLGIVERRRRKKSMKNPQLGPSQRKGKRKYLSPVFSVVFVRDLDSFDLRLVRRAENLVFCNLGEKINGKEKIAVI